VRVKQKEPLLKSGSPQLSVGKKKPKTNTTIALHKNICDSLQDISLQPK
jgi:hypothetical protein